LEGDWTEVKGPVAKDNYQILAVAPDKGNPRRTTMDDSTDTTFEDTKAAFILRELDSGEKSK
jgi:hypothetical protein